MQAIEKMADFLRTLGNPTRLMIVKELTVGHKCVGEVESSLKISQANASQHLHILKSNDIVDCIRQGTTRCYFLKNPELIRNLLKLIEQKIP